MSEQKASSFFSKDNIHRAGWAVLIGICAFVGGQVYNKMYGPPKVVLDSQRPPVIQVTVQQPETPQAMTSDDAKRLSNALANLQKTSESQMSNQQLINLSAEVQQLRKSLSQNSTSTEPTVPNINIPLPVASQKPFELPNNVKGYFSVPLSGINNSSCPPENITSNADLKVAFNVIDKNLIFSASPIYFRINRIDGKLNLTQIIEKNSELKSGHNEITFSAELLPAEYNLSYGYYLRSELDKEFPNFYSKVCKLKVNSI